MTPSCLYEISLLFIIRRHNGGIFSIEILDESFGLLIFQVNDEVLFANEAGGHRWQRVPPTEHRGRVHTSTITVAILPEINNVVVDLNDSDLNWKATRGNGPGGQNRNKVETAIVLTHLPTNIVVRIDTGRSQYHNKEMALKVMKARLYELYSNGLDAKINNSRRAQVGSGMRGDKRRTIRVKDGIVTDHILGLKMSLNKYLSGELPQPC